MFLQQTDKKLVDKALAGSERAWLKLVKRYEVMLFNYLLRMVGSKEEALDLLQEVLLAVFRQLPGFREDASFKTWVFRIAANKTVDYIRRKGPIQESIEDHEIMDYRDPVEDVARVKEKEALQHFLQILPVDQRLVIELKVFQQFTFEEIAHHLSISPNTAKTRFYSAIKSLKPRLEQQNVL